VLFSSWSTCTAKAHGVRRVSCIAKAIETLLRSHLAHACPGNCRKVSHIADLRIVGQCPCTWSRNRCCSGEQVAVQSMKAWSSLLLFSFGTFVSFSVVSSTCVGNSCPEAHEQAASAGLLGATVSASTCHTKTYPQSGTLAPVGLLCYATCCWR
jgi:hypothetical protein